MCVCVLFAECGWLVEYYDFSKTIPNIDCFILFDKVQTDIVDNVFQTVTGECKPLALLE